MDTHWNGPLKREWIKVINDHLHSCDIVKINRFEFLRNLTVVWEKMKEKREIIRKSFEYCGIFPLKNVVLPEEYSISKCFEQNTRSSKKPGFCKKYSCNAES